MLNGKCKAWREGNSLRFEMCLQTPTGPIVVSDKVEAEVDDPTAIRRLQSKVKGIAGFFPTEEMVGEEIIGAAENLYQSFMDPEKRDEVGAQVDAVMAAAENGDDGAFDVAYALDRIVSAQAEKIGASWFKRRRKRSIRSALMPTPFGVPLAARRMVRQAKRSPAAARQVEAIVRAAVTPPGALPVRDAEGNPAPAPVVEAMQEKAQQAVEALEAAAQVEEQYPDQPIMDADQATSEEYDEVSGAMSVYQDGASTGDLSEEEISGLLSFAKKIGRVVDPTKKGSLFSGALSYIPGIGPAVQASANLIASAKSGNKAAIDKIKAIKELAGSGVPKATEALDNLAAAQNLQKKLEREVAEQTNPGRFGRWWLPRTYRAGALTVS